MFFEPALFGVTGATIHLKELGEDLDLMAIGVGILVTTGVVRIISTALIAFGDNLNLKEKVRNVLFEFFGIIKNVKQIYPVHFDFIEASAPV